jgi:hypothetical protein
MYHEFLLLDANNKNVDDADDEDGYDDDDSNLQF